MHNDGSGLGIHGGYLRMLNCPPVTTYITVSNSGILAFDNTQTIEGVGVEGTGKLVFLENGSNRMTIEGDSVLTIAASMAVFAEPGPDNSLGGYAFRNGNNMLVNYGLISTKEAPGGRFTIEADRFINYGRLEDLGCALRITTPDWRNEGTFLYGCFTAGISTGYTQTSGVSIINGNYNANNGTGLVDIQGGTLRGMGTVTGHVTSAGTVSPGASPGLFTITGNYTQASTGSLNIEIGGLTPGTQHDRLAVNSTATLNGTLNISFINGYTPRIGDTFVIMTYGAHNGTFANVTVPPNYYIDVYYNNTNITLRITNASVTISGTISLEECVNPAQTITFEFRRTPSIYNFTRTTTLGPNGTFTLTGVPGEEYGVWIKGAKWLARVISVNASAGNVTGMTAFLRAGDANNSNGVDVDDLAALIESFDADPTSPNWHGGVADFDCNSIVDVDDLNLLIRNFDREGDL